MQNQPQTNEFSNESTKKIEKMKFCVISRVYGTLIHKTNLLYFMLDTQS